jgi:hypothetical protein
MIKNMKKQTKQKRINYYDTPQQRRQHGNFYTDVISALMGFVEAHKNDLPEEGINIDITVIKKIK